MNVTKGAYAGHTGTVISLTPKMVYVNIPQIPKRKRASPTDKWTLHIEEPVPLEDVFGADSAAPHPPTHQRRRV